MSCHEIRSHISRLPLDQIFCTRDLLHLSTRANVDQTLFRMVRRGMIKRLARGVFVRDLLFTTTARTIATVRAEAFGKKVAPHASELLEEAGLAKTPRHETLAFWGRRGSFLYGQHDHRHDDLQRFLLSETCARKYNLAQSNCGTIMRSIWHLQKENCSWKKVQALTARMNSEDNRSYTSIVRLIPAWLSDYFYLVRIGRIRDCQEADGYWSKYWKAHRAA